MYWASLDYNMGWLGFCFLVSVSLNLTTTIMFEVNATAKQFFGSIILWFVLVYAIVCSCAFMWHSGLVSITHN